MMTFPKLESFIHKNLRDGEVNDFWCIQEKIIHVLGKTQACIPMHTVAIWTFTFHGKSGSLYVSSWFGGQISNQPIGSIH